MQVHRARLNAPVARRRAGLRDPGPRPPQRRAESGPHRPAHDIDPRQSRLARRVEPGSTWVMATGVTAPLQARKEAAGWGWPHARLRASRRTLGARRDQGGHGPPAPPINNSLPASRSRGQGLQVAG